MSSFQLSFERWDSVTFWLTFIGTVLLAVGVMTGVKARGYARSLTAEKDKEAEEAQLAHDRAIAVANTQIETLRKDTAEANTRAAEANEKAEHEKLERLKIEQKIAPRALSPAQRKSIGKKLSGFSLREPVPVFLSKLDVEIIAFANQLSDALKLAGWEVDGGTKSYMGRVVVGVLVEVHEKTAVPQDRVIASALVTILRREGVDASGPVATELGLTALYNGNALEAPIQLVVGEKVSV